MKPVNVSPSKPVDGGAVVYAEDQPEYQSLPSWKRQSGEVVTRWRLSWRERIAVFMGRDLYLGISTFGAPLQPLYPTVNERDMFGWTDE